MLLSPGGVRKGAAPSLGAGVGAELEVEAEEVPSPPSPQALNTTERTATTSRGSATRRKDRRSLCSGNWCLPQGVTRGAMIWGGIGLLRSRPHPASGGRRGGDCAVVGEGEEGACEREDAATEPRRRGARGGEVAVDSTVVGIGAVQHEVQGKKGTVGVERRREAGRDDRAEGAGGLPVQMEDEQVRGGRRQGRIKVGDDLGAVPTAGVEGEHGARGGRNRGFGVARLQQKAAAADEGVATDE